MKDKKAFASIIFWVALSFVTVTIFGLWLWMHNILTVAFLSIKTIGGVNVTDAVVKTLVPVNSALQGLHFIAFIIIFVEGISLLIVSLFIDDHPALYIVHVFIAIVAVFLSAYVSNSYESLLTDPLLGSTFMGFKAASYILLNLPIWTFILGLFGAIFLAIRVKALEPSGP